MLSAAWARPTARIGWPRDPRAREPESLLVGQIIGSSVSEEPFDGVRQADLHLRGEPSQRRALYPWVDSMG